MEKTSLNILTNMKCQKCGKNDATQKFEERIGEIIDLCDTCFNEEVDLQDNMIESGMERMREHEKIY